ncbi:MAG: hypothetical protein AAB577_00795 [Patescibacteria group bacterium]
MSYKESSGHGGEMDLIHQGLEMARKEKAELYSKQPELLVDEIQEMADEHPNISGKKYFMAFAAGCLVERYGISVPTADKAVKVWSSNKKAPA